MSITFWKGSVQPMAKYKKKPVLPIYTIAIVWVIYTLVHPLYQVSEIGRAHV